MSPRGRKPKPTRLKILEGNPGKRPLNLNEPQCEEGIPECPEFLCTEAKQEWNLLAPMLHNSGLLTKLDRNALAALCQVWARWLKAEELLKKHGLLVKSPNNFLMQNPALAIANKSLEQMRLLLTEFGLTPSSRSRIPVTKSELDDDPMLLLIN